MFPGKQDKVVASVEARMSSTRLPGKVLLPLGGVPALEVLISRLRRSQYVDEIVVATTTASADDAIVALCAGLGCTYFRGSDEDVLGRVLAAVRSVGGQLIVQITADCPLVDHRHVDGVISEFYASDVHYCSNNVPRSFPNGFDVQVFPTSVLEYVDTLTTDPIDRVHVSHYIYTHPDMFQLRSVSATGIMRWPDLGVTLDEPADHRLIDRIYTDLVADRPDFSAVDIVRHLRQHPDLCAINHGVRRKQPSEG